MSRCLYRVPPQQSTAFHLAVCQRLGIDPTVVSEDFNVEWGNDGSGTVTFTAHIPAAELREMFNDAGRLA